MLNGLVCMRLGRDDATYNIHVRKYCINIHVKITGKLNAGAFKPPNVESEN